MLIDGGGQIVAGHGRVAAALQLGLSEVPTIELGPLGCRAPGLCDRRQPAGRTGRLGSRDPGDRFQALAELDLDFELEITGFETAELDFLLDDGKNAEADPADAIPLPDPGSAVTRRGDGWQLGRHRLLCGDARELSGYAALMVVERARCVFTEPPYNVKIDGHVCGSGTIRHREFAMASGEMDEERSPAFFTPRWAPWPM